MMNREEFDRLVRQVEAGVGRNHAALRRRAAGLAFLGYAGLLTWLLLVLLIAAGFFSGLVWADAEGKIFCGLAGLLVLGLGGWASLRILLVRLTPPKGRAITRAEAPALFAELDDLRARLRAAPFHEVLLSAEFNAGVVQMPRLGVLGWPRNCLILGLPLLDALSPAEMRAVLAHEFAHLSRAHGRLSHWLYRLRRSWEETFRQFARPQVRGTLSLRPLTAKFVDWFWPRFNAHAFVLSRANEYEADAHAARLAGAPHLAAALVRLQTLTRLLDQRLWPGLWQLTHTLPAPPDDLLARLRDGLRAGATPEDRARWTEEAFRTASTNSDTHPCLSERLSALQVPPVPPADTAAAASPSAAETLLGPALDGLRRDVQEFWRKEAGPQWREQHARAAAFSDRLASLDRAVPAAAVNLESLWDKAHALLSLRDHAAAAPLLREILARRADHAPANFQLGRLLLDAGDAEGVAHLERAMAANEELVPEACGLLHHHHRQLGHTDRLHALAVRLDRHEKELAASRAERTAVTAADTFLPHGLAAPELEALRRTFAAEPELARAELAQKELKHFTHQRLFVLCVRRQPAWHRLQDAEQDRALTRRLTQGVRLPGRVLVFPPTGGFRALARKLRHVAGSAVWP